MRLRVAAAARPPGRWVLGPGPCQAAHGLLARMSALLSNMPGALPVVPHRLAHPLRARQPVCCAAAAQKANTCNGPARPGAWLMFVMMLRVQRLCSLCRALQATLSRLRVRTTRTSEALNAVTRC